MSLKGKIASVALTDTGKVREHNEDMIGTEADIGLFVLADGMGGYNAGEVASGIAVKTIINLVRDAFVREDLSVTDAETGLTRPSIILRDAIHRANKIIYHTSKTQPQCEGMGTTVVACLFHDNKSLDRPRRRFTGLPSARQPFRADDPGSFAAAGTGRPRFLFAARSAAGDQQELCYTGARGGAECRSRDPRAAGTEKSTTTYCVRMAFRT